MSIPEDFAFHADSTAIHDPKNKHPIEKLWAFLSVDEYGNEGIVANGDDKIIMPLVTGDEKELKGLADIANKLSLFTKKEIVCAEFVRTR